MCVNARGASGQTRATCGKQDARGARKVKARGSAGCADARSAQTHGTRRRAKCARRRIPKFETPRGARPAGGFRPRLSRRAPALGRQGHRASPAAPATQSKLEPRPRAQGTLRLAGRVRASKEVLSLGAVSTSYQESENRKNRHKTTRPRTCGRHRRAP